MILYISTMVSKFFSVRSRLVRISFFCLLSLSLVSWDKMTKDLAKAHLRDKPAQSFLGDTFRLEYVENTGAAMSMADDWSPGASFWLLSVLPLAVLLGLFAYVIRHIQEIRTSRMIGLCLIFAGGVGNIMDRLVFDRHVTDFMNIGVRNLRTGIFNFADLWITAGVVSLLVWRGGWPGKDGARVDQNG
jgi:signal peptidase II